MTGRKIIIIAGPNGAGKTTFARNFLPYEAHTLRFINADLIAAGLSPFAPEHAAIKAGRLMLQEIMDSVARGENFAFETTLSGKRWLQHIHHWRTHGWHIALYFLALPSVGMAISRVAERVRQGGHYIPDTVIGRRFEAGLYNFEHRYKHWVDEWTHYDNSGHTPVLLASGENP